MNRKPYASLEALKQAQRVIALHDPNVLKLKMDDMIEERADRAYLLLIDHMDRCLAC